VNSKDNIKCRFESKIEFTGLCPPNIMKK